MNGGTAALLVGGGLVVVGGAVYLARKKQAAKDDQCAELGAIDPRAATICRLVGPLSGSVKEFVDGVTHTTNKVGWTILEPVSRVVNSIISAFSGSSLTDKEKCEKIRDDVPPYVGLRGVADIKSGCAKLGVTW